MQVISKRYRREASHREDRHPIVPTIRTWSRRTLAFMVGPWSARPQLQQLILKRRAVRSTLCSRDNRGARTWHPQAVNISQYYLLGIWRSPNCHLAPLTTTTFLGRRSPQLVVVAGHQEVSPSPSLPSHRPASVLREESLALNTRRLHPHQNSFTLKMWVASLENAWYQATLGDKQLRARMWFHTGTRKK